MTGLTSIILHNIQHVGINCFQNSSKLVSVHLGDIHGANVSGNGYFWFNGLTEIELCELGAETTSLDSIGHNAPFGAIRTVSSKTFKLVVHSVTPPTTTGYNMFSQTTAKYSIYVPDESVDSYKASSGWSMSASYILPLSSYPNPSELLYLE